MKASVVDLRYRMNDVLKALNRNEEVQILYHGKVKGVIKPEKSGNRQKVSKHPFFRMSSTSTTVEDEVAGLRGGRYRDL